MTKAVVKPTKVPKAAPVVADKNALNVQVKKGDTADVTIAKKLTNPKVTAVMPMRELQPMLKQQDINEVIVALNDEVNQVVNGKMTRPEEMLVTQAHTLDMLFSVLAQRSITNMNGGFLPAADTYMRMALKAQSQCRTTLEALSEIKNPRTATFIKQQNVAGQQQVNNGQGAAQEKNISPTNELLEAQHGERLDIGKAGTPGAVNPKLAAVAAIDRAKVGAGKTERFQKFV